MPGYASDGDDFPGCDRARADGRRAFCRDHILSNRRWGGRVYVGSDALLSSTRVAPRTAPVGGAGLAGSSLHHLALSLPYAEQDAAMRWYDHLGQSYRIKVFAWVGWRGIFTQDREDNTVELVAHHPDLLDPRAS